MTLGFLGVSKDNETALEETMVEKEMCDAEEKVRHPSFPLRLPVYMVSEDLSSRKVFSQVSILEGIREVFRQPHLRTAYFIGVASLQVRIETPKSKKKT